MNIDLYAQAVESRAKLRSSERFTNKGPLHAQVVVEWLFRTSQSTVRLFAKTMSSEVYLGEGVKAAAAEFFARANTRLFVVTEEKIDAQTATFFSAFASQFVHYQLQNDLPLTGRLQHFIVGDDSAFRIETDREAREAIVSFNEPESAIKLAGVFEALEGFCDSKASQ